MLRAVLLWVVMGWIAGCSETPEPESSAVGAPVQAADAASEQLLNDMEGVWRSSAPDQLMYLVRDGRNLRMLSGGAHETDVQLRSVDAKAQSVNLSVAAAGGRVVWTIRKVPDAGNEAPGYGLLVTMNGGEQLELALVRRISPEDREFMTGELARALREEREAAVAEVDAEPVSEFEDAAVAVAMESATRVSSDDVKVSKTRLDDQEREEPATRAVAFATSFDCGKATKAAEAAVCHDADLAMLDQRLARGYRMALANEDQPESLRSSQMRWLKDRRDACEHDIDCLRRIYRQRLKYFEGAPHYMHSDHAE